MTIQKVDELIQVDEDNRVERRLNEDLKTGRGKVVSSIKSAIELVKNEGNLFFCNQHTLIFHMKINYSCN